ncbi:hypothetical protein [Saccharicrinis fermentans]|uniref:hypothetical protein n=1 Tax=Saccharicrinis fermentans TaxID=982 RepID=UPI00126964A6|nr:hypothetical protein [Saccharicrinis fermentans]
MTKKIYSKPQLEVVNVDHEISLVMASVPDPGEGGGGGDLPSASAVTSSPIPEFNSSSESSVFGGSAPDYSN